LVTAIEQCDREIASIGRDAGSAELDRLESQLAALHVLSPDESADRHDLRQLVQNQLQLMRRMHARGEALSHQRAHQLHLMRGLWAQLCLVRSAMSAGPAAATRDIERLRALCEEIADAIATPTARADRGAASLSPESQRATVGRRDR
jgi:hypothetical protein